MDHVDLLPFNLLPSNLELPTNGNRRIKQHHLTNRRPTKHRLALHINLNSMDRHILNSLCLHHEEHFQVHRDYLLPIRIYPQRL